MSLRRLRSQLRDAAKSITYAEERMWQAALRLREAKDTATAVQESAGKLGTPIVEELTRLEKAAWDAFSLCPQYAVQQLRRLLCGEDKL